METLKLLMHNTKNNELENILYEFDFLEQVVNVTEREFWTTWEIRLEDDKEEDLLLSILDDNLNN